MTVSTFFHVLKSRPPLRLLAQLSELVGAVEAELRLQMSSDVELVEQIGALTLGAGGKRLRPALCAISAAASGGVVTKERIVRLGACLELIHMATLIHDDVIDGAATRRGKPTASIIFGNTSAILTGDVLLAKAMKLLAEDGDLAIIRMVSAAVTELAEGEVKEVAVRGDYLLPQEDHLKILRMKTAAFTECCCRVGAMAAGAGEAQIQALGLYGHHLGMAFQIIDDILDFRGDHAKTGKPLATDFREGQATLPLILLNDTLSQEEKVFVEEKFGNGVSDADLAMIIRWMTERKAIQKAFLMAEEEGAKAQGQLAALPKSEERDVLHSIIEFVLSRES